MMLLSLLLLSFVALVTSTATCYFPSGKVSGALPCNSTSTDHSACCAAGNLCMSSGLCFNQGLISRGSCTDATWKDASCAQTCVDWNRQGACAVTPRSLSSTDVATMDWCCDFPLANGSCVQGFTINVQAGTVLVGNTATSGTPGVAHDCETSHDIAIGLGVGIPTMIACLTMLLLYLRERRARRKERQKQKPKPASLHSDETPWLKDRTKGRSVTTITSEEPPWVKRRAEDHEWESDRPEVPAIPVWANSRAEAPAWGSSRAEAPGSSRIPQIELQEGPWIRELP